MDIKKIFVGTLITLSTIIIFIVLLILYDLHLNNKFHNRGGFNHRGYRGKIVGKKKSNEIRIGVLGGSVAMGYGVHYTKSIAASLEKFIGSKNFKKKYTVINLAAAGESCGYFLKDTCNLFSYMKIDVIIFYFTDDELFEKNPDKIMQYQRCKRSANWCLTHFNYYFIFPTVLREKYYLIRYGDISQGYRKDKVFRKMDNLLSRMISPLDREDLPDFVRKLTSKGKIFIFVISPAEVSEAQDRFNKKLKPYLINNFANNSQVIVADLTGIFCNGNLSDYMLNDGLHYSEKGSQKVAEELFRYIPFNMLENEN